MSSLNNNLNHNKLLSACRYYPDSSRWRIGAYWLLCFLLITILIISRYTFILDFWWSYDDAHHLKFALQNHPKDYLFKPEVYRKFQDLYIAPWNILAYSINLKLFGSDPYGFYIRHLISMSLLGITTFVFLRLWLSTAFA